MLTIDRNAFDEKLADFDVLVDSAKINKKTELLSGSRGSTIDALNECFDAYNKYCLSINTLCSSTSRYLHQAFNNLNACEFDNIVKVTDNLSGEKK